MNHSFIQENFGISTRKFIFILFVIVLFGVYLSNLWVGNSSLSVLLNLKSYKKNLQQEVVWHKNQNAKLQKEYFELIEILPDKE